MTLNLTILEIVTETAKAKASGQAAWARAIEKAAEQLVSNPYICKKDGGLLIFKRELAEASNDQPTRCERVGRCDKSILPAPTTYNQAIRAGSFTALPFRLSKGNQTNIPTLRTVEQKRSEIKARRAERKLYDREKTIALATGVICALIFLGGTALGSYHAFVMIGPFAGVLATASYLIADAVII